MLLYLRSLRPHSYSMRPPWNQLSRFYCDQPSARICQTEIVQQSNWTIRAARLHALLSVIQCPLLSLNVTLWTCKNVCTVSSWLSNQTIHGTGEPQTNRVWWLGVVSDNSEFNNTFKPCGIICCVIFFITYSRRLCVFTTLCTYCTARYHPSKFSVHL